MISELKYLTDNELRSLWKSGREVLRSMEHNLRDSEMQESVQSIISCNDPLETFHEMALLNPDLMRVVLETSVAALVNSQRAEAIGEELKTRAAKGN